MNYLWLNFRNNPATMNDDDDNDAEAETIDSDTCLLYTSDAADE